MHHFCTYFDRHYLAQGLALYGSLERHCQNGFHLWILCFDDETYHTLAALGLPHVSLIPHTDLESSYPALQSIKPHRTRVEYYWTCTPFLPLYVFRRNPELEVITYLDADLCFFSDPAPVLAELGDQSILMVEQRYPAERAHEMADYGFYNVSFNGFRHDAEGLACLTWWGERCLEWCYQRVEAGKFGDQKYLDEWPQRFRRVVVAQHPGIGLAHWNINEHALTRRHGHVLVDGRHLVYYHFSRFRLFNRVFYRPAINARITVTAKRYIYEPYVRAIGQARYMAHDSGLASETNLSWPRAACWVLKGDLELVGSTRWLPAMRLAFRTGQSLYHSLLK